MNAKKIMRSGTVAAFAMVLFCFAGSGCGTESVEDTQNAGSSSDRERRDTSAEGILTRDFSQKEEITYAGVYVTEGFDYNHGNAYNEWWTETFNVEWEPTGMTFENWDERMNTWINAEDLPDWSIWQFNAGDAVKYAEQELVKELPEDWREKYPNLAAASENSPLTKHYEEELGGTYYLFRPMFAENFPADTITPHEAVFLRKDWAKQAGVDLSSNEESHTITISEWFEYMRKVKDAGLCEYPLYNSPLELLNVISSSANHAGGTHSDVFYRGDDGIYHWGPAEEDNGIKEVLAKFHEAYMDGLIYPEFYTLESNEYEDYYSVNGAAATYFNRGLPSLGDLNNSKMSENLGLNFWDVSSVFVLTDDNGVAYGDPELNYWGCSILSPDISDEKLERLLTIWDYACTDEGYKQTNLGIRGEDWDEEADGDIKSYLADSGELLVNKYEGVYPIINGMFIISNDFEFIDPAITERSKEEISKLFAARAKVYYSKDKEPDWDLLGYNSQALNVASYAYETEYANLITREGDFDKVYDSWISEKSGIIQAALDDLNKNLAE